MPINRPYTAIWVLEERYRFYHLLCGSLQNDLQVILLYVLVQYKGYNADRRGG